jgi:dTDP-4-dehydrorhamnose 3,5-epimerase
MDKTIEGVIVTQLKQVRNPKGDILHGLRFSESSYNGFGEAYFSCILPKEIKGWKKHKLAQLNIIVPLGEIEFVLFDNRLNSTTNGTFQSVILGPSSENTYKRLTIPNEIWVAFRSTRNEIGILLDIMDIEHSDLESEKESLDFIKFAW